MGKWREEEGMEEDREIGKRKGRRGKDVRTSAREED